MQKLFETAVRQICFTSACLLEVRDRRFFQPEKNGALSELLFSSEGPRLEAWNNRRKQWQKPFFNFSALNKAFFFVR